MKSMERALGCWSYATSDLEGGYIGMYHLGKLIYYILMIC